ncbi:ABC-type Fe3+-siderophore transport system, permease component [Corynebacterium pseudotuberculosis]|nr:ABC-type Fe3+-siderophore transport system, permease component [Corynebacterium pseudotuberculosis]
MMTHRRSWYTALILTLLLAVSAAVAVSLPGAGITTAKVWSVFQGDDSSLAHTIVFSWRAPRIVTALFVGAALGIAGSLFQALTRNPLGSPDIIGFNTGAYTGVLLTMMAGMTSFASVAFGALAGGLATALAVMAFSVRVRIDGLRIILVGLGVSAMLSAFNRWLITRGDLNTALSAASWGAGTLNGIRWAAATPAVIALGIIVALALLLGSRIDILNLGDDTATALGLPVNPSKFVLLIVGVLLIATTTAIAGPISFIALASPHIAQRITASPRTPLLVSALTGATLLLVADIIAQRAFAPVQLPVGLVTVVIGGIYLLSLIASASRRA